MTTPTAPPPQPVRIPVPSGDIIDLCSKRDFAREMVATISAENLITVLNETSAPPYDAEAYIHEFKKLATPRSVAVVEAALLGITQQHPLRPLRDLLKTNVESVKSATPDVALWLWGASAKTGRILYAEAGTLLRAPWFETHVVSHPELYGSNDAAALVMAWARASGVSNDKTLAALWKVIEDHFLTRRPAQVFAKLDFNAMQFARSVAGEDAKLAVMFFRCLQRVVAWSFRGRVRWRSSWLRGRGAGGENAILGASTDGARLTALLNQHVFRKVLGHSKGKGRPKAATYEMTVELNVGNNDITDMARMMGVELGEDGAPKRTRAA
jgi:hypothetical protein